MRDAKNTPHSMNVRLTKQQQLEEKYQFRYQGITTAQFSATHCDLDHAVPQRPIYEYRFINKSAIPNNSTSSKAKTRA